MRSISSLAVVLLVATFAAESASADLLDRLRRKADEVSQEAREVSSDVETATNVEGRAETEVAGAQAQAEQAVPTEQTIESGARSEAESTDAALAVRDVEGQTDVEGRAQAEIQSTDAAVATRAAQSEIDVAASTDERIEAEVDAVSSTDERLEAEVDGTQDTVKRAIEDVKEL